MLNDDAVQMIAAEAEQADWDNDLEKAFSNPTVSSLTELLTHPKRVEQIEAAWNGYRDDQRTRNIQDALVIGSALNRGGERGIELAIERLTDRGTALRKGATIRNSLGRDGRHPPESTQHTAALLRGLKSGDPERIKRVKAYVGMAIAFAVHPEEAADALRKVGFKDDRTKAQKEAPPPPDMIEGQGEEV